MTRKTSETTEQYLERMAARDRDDLRSILNTAHGRRFIWRLLSKCGIHQLGVVMDSINATYFNAGMRNIGNTLLAQVLEVKPEAYLEMTKMAKGDEHDRRIVEAANNIQEH